MSGLFDLNDSDDDAEDDVDDAGPQPEPDLPPNTLAQHGAPQVAVASGAEQNAAATAAEERDDEQVGADPDNRASPEVAPAESEILSLPPIRRETSSEKEPELCGINGCILLNKHAGLCVFTLLCKDDRQRQRAQPFSAGAPLPSVPKPARQPSKPKPSALDQWNALGDGSNPGHQGDNSWEVRALIDRRIGRQRRKEYLVSWQGWSSEFDEWVAAKDIESSLVAEYDAAHPQEATDSPRPAPARATAPTNRGEGASGEETSRSPTQDGWLRDGHEWIGQTVRRFFDHRHADGKVVSWLPEDTSSRAPALWHVIHTDGDEEDLEEGEMNDALAAFTQGTTLAPGWRVEGHPWIGMSMRRFFDERLIDGKVVRWFQGGDEHENLWHVVHEDGDEEDLNEDEMALAIVDFQDGLEEAEEEPVMETASAVEQNTAWWAQDAVRRDAAGHSAPLNAAEGEVADLPAMYRQTAGLPVADREAEEVPTEKEESDDEELDALGQQQKGGGGEYGRDGAQTLVTEADGYRLHLSSKSNSSGYKGVVSLPANNAGVRRWQARHGRKSLGCFPTPVQAAVAYARAVGEAGGDEEIAALVQQIVIPQ